MRPANQEDKWALAAGSCAFGSVVGCIINPSSVVSVLIGGIVGGVLGYLSAPLAVYFVRANAVRKWERIRSRNNQRGRND